MARSARSRGPGWSSACPWATDTKDAAERPALCLGAMGRASRSPSRGSRTRPSSEAKRRERQVQDVQEQREKSFYETGVDPQDRR